MKMKLIIKNKIIKGNNDCIDILQNRKENAFNYGIKGISLDKKTPVEILDVRFYGNGTRKYCCLWLKDKKNNNYCSAGNYAGGYGYHKQSSAFALALSKIGIDAVNLDSAGKEAMLQAVKAILKKQGYKKVYIVECYG
jgi:hypothetical protein